MRERTLGAPHRVSRTVGPGDAPAQKWLRNARRRRAVAPASTDREGLVRVVRQRGRVEQTGGLLAPIQRDAPCGFDRVRRSSAR